MTTALSIPRRTRRLDTGSREVDLPVDALGRERWVAKLDQRNIERRDDSTEVGFVGHASVFNKRTWIGPKKWGFWEQVAPSAYDKTIGECDCRFLVNHNPDLLLARNTAGTLELSKDKIGLLTEATMDVRQTYANDVVIALERGDISQMSFAFETVKDQWETLDNGDELRTLLEVKLWDVSVVTYPAYGDTDAGLRGAAFETLLRTAGITDEVQARLLRGLTTDDDDAELAELVRQATAALSNLTTEPPESTRTDNGQPAEPTGAPLDVLQLRHRLAGRRLRLTA